MKNNIKNIRKYNNPYYTMGTGGIIQYNKGETHENSLIGGTPVDENGNITTINNTKPVALVEKGEISFKTPQGETIVFSNKIPLKDKGKTFADEAKSIKNKFKFRLGENNEKHDPISSNELTKQMMNLFSQQEDKKQILGLNDDERNNPMVQQKNGGQLIQITQPDYFDLMSTGGMLFEGNIDPDDIDKMKHGGTIHIKPENKGKFNALKKRTGKTTEELTHSKNPLTRKRAIFAQNAAKWHHKGNGGEVTETSLDQDIKKNVENPKRKEETSVGAFYKDGQRIYPVMGITNVLKNPDKYKKLEAQKVEGNTVWPDIYYTTEEPKDPNEKFAFDKYNHVRVVTTNGISEFIPNDYRLAQYMKKANGGGLPKYGLGNWISSTVKKGVNTLTGNDGFQFSDVMPTNIINNITNPYDPQINSNQEEITGVGQANKINDEIIAYLNANKVNVDPGQFNQDISSSQYTPGTYNASTYNASKYTPAKDYVAQTTTYNPITGEKIDLSQQRENIKQNTIGSRANLSSSIRNSGLSAGQQMANLLAGTTSLNTSSNQAIGESYMTEKAKNAEIANEINRFNATNKLETERFNVGNTNQANQFNIGNRNQASQFNAQMANQAGQFNATAANQAGQFNIGSANEAAKFNTSNKLNVDASNIANKLRASMFNAQSNQDLTNQVAGLMSQKGQNILQGNQTYNTYKTQQEELAKNKHDEGLLGLGLFGLKCGGKLPMHPYGGELGVTAIPSINFAQVDAIEQRRRQAIQDRNSKLMKLGELFLTSGLPITSVSSKNKVVETPGFGTQIPDNLRFQSPEYYKFSEGGKLKSNRLKLKYI